MLIKIITTICFFFLSYVVLLTILNLNNRMDKMTLELQTSNLELRELKQELVASQTLIGSVDAEVTLPTQ